MSRFYLDVVTDVDHEKDAGGDRKAGIRLISS